MFNRKKIKKQKELEHIIGDITHSLSTPLVTALSYINTLKSEIISPENIEAQERACIISSKGVDCLKAIELEISALLDFERFLSKNFDKSKSNDVSVYSLNQLFLDAFDRYPARSDMEKKILANNLNFVDFDIIFSYKDFIYLIKRIFYFVISRSRRSDFDIDFITSPEEKTLIIQTMIESKSLANSKHKKCNRHINTEYSCLNDIEKIINDNGASFSLEFNELDLSRLIIRFK